MDIISFPKLSLNIPVNSVAFTVFGKEIYFYGIIIAVGIILATVYTMREAKKNGIKDDVILDIVLFSIPAAIIFARAYYVIFKWEDYAQNPIEAFAIWQGGIAIYGALIGGFISTYIYCRVKKLSFTKILDISAIGLLIGQAIGRWGNFVNREAFGTNTSLPFGMTSKTISEYLQELSLKGIKVDPNFPVHPTFLYESLWNIVGIFIITKYKKIAKFDGEIFLFYIFWYGLGRAMIESLRLDSLMLGNARFSQIIAILSLAVSLFAIFFIRIFLSGNKKELNIN